MAEVPLNGTPVERLAEQVQQLAGDLNRTGKASTIHEQREVLKQCFCGGKVVRVTTLVRRYEAFMGDVTAPKQETYCESCKLMYHNSLT